MIILINWTFAFPFSTFFFQWIQSFEKWTELKSIQTTPWVTKLNPFSYLSLLHDYFQTARIVLRLILTSFYVSFFIDCYSHCLSSFIYSRKSSSNMRATINWINLQYLTQFIPTLTWTKKSQMFSSIPLLVNCLIIISNSNLFIDLFICNPFLSCLSSVNTN